MLLGLVVLSTLLVSVAMARGRFLRQWADADRRVKQVAAADALVAAWMAGPPEAVPLAGTGPAGDGDVWRTRAVPSPAAAQLGAVIVRLGLFGRSSLGGGPPDVSVDFLVHRVPTTRPVVR